MYGTLVWHSFLFLLLALASACYSTSLVQDARVLAPGRVRGMVSVEYAPTGARPDHILIEGGARVGLARRVELQLKTTNHNGYGAAVKVALRDDSSPLRVSILTGVQYAQVELDHRREMWRPTRSVFGVNLTPVLGLRLDKAVELIVAPDLQMGFKKGNSFRGEPTGVGPNMKPGPVVPGYRAPWLGLGVRAGVALHASARLTLIPECSVLVIVRGSAVRPGEYDERVDRATPDDVFAQGDVRGQCGLALNVGSAYQER